MRLVRTSILSATLVALSAPAFAQSDADRATARSLAESGIALQAAGHPAEALDKLQRAQALFSAPPHLLHIAQCQVALGQLVEASETYRALARVELDAKAPAPFRAAQDDGARELAALRARVPSLHVDVPSPPRDLVVKLDGVALPAAVLGVDRPTNPGSHKLEASAPGFAPMAATIKLAESEHKTLAVTLKPDAAAVIAPIPPPPAKTEPAAAPPQAAATPASPGADTVGPGHHLHDGFFLRLAVGAGAITDTETLKGTNNATGATASEDVKITGSPVEFELSIGGAVSPGLIVAATAIAARIESPTVTAGGVEQTAQSTVTATHTLLGGTVDYYPNPKGGLHFGGTAGYATLTVTDSSKADSTNDVTPKGFGMAGHVGYSWWVGGDFSLGAMGRVTYSRLTADVPSGVPDVTVKETDSNVMTTLGIEMTYN